MWQKLNISQELYFINVYLDENDNLNCLLIGTKDFWLQTLTLTEIKQTVELLNKRIEYNEYIGKVLLNDEVKSATFEKIGKNDSAGNLDKLLNIKYNVQGVTLRFQWLLKRQTTTEFHNGFLLPLLNDIQSCVQQIEELKETIRLKDKELEGYRREGFILHRKTLSTKAFNFAEFDKKYENHLQQFFDLISETKAFAIVKKSITPVSNKSLKSVTSPDKSELKLKQKTSPQKRKHEAFQLLNQKYNLLKQSKQCLQYESQSSTASSETLNPSPHDNKVKKTAQNRKLSAQRLNKEGSGNTQVVENNGVIQDNYVDIPHNNKLNEIDINYSQDIFGDFEDTNEFNFKEYDGKFKYLCLDTANAKQTLNIPQITNIDDIHDITIKLDAIKTDLQKLERLRLADLGKHH